ncbi:hypothetical protein [Chitinophaga deserti]|uniref:hypothetical protein n=1 Tax=Chitinophaga deserti TaxID=2164099 RepID=UPI000D6C36F5|nr:hypothetical protein [Chitinophaga deserti]
MKNRILLTLALIITMGLGAYAQQGGGQQRRTVEERVKMTLERLTTELQLSKEQVVKLDTLFTRSFKEQQKMREDAQASGNRPDRETFQKMSNERDEKVKAILTDDQFKKYKEQQEAMRQRGGNRGGGGGQR